jgi:hypothetical protein
MKDYPKILTAAVDFGKNGGTYVLNEHGGIQGKPFPSESEAWAFDKGVKLMNKFMFMPYAEKLALLAKYDL